MGHGGNSLRYRTPFGPHKLVFRSFGSPILLLLSVLVVNGVVRRASATYLEGAMMVGAYLVVAVTYFFREHDQEYGSKAHNGICICGTACCVPPDITAGEP